MANFSHLKLTLKVDATPKSGKAIVKPSEQTKKNLENKESHANILDEQREKLDLFWESYISQRKANGFPDLPEPKVVPVLLTVDKKVFDIESLKAFGIEIVSEEEDGKIVGASTDSFKSLREKIEKLRNERHGGKSVAQLWEINEGIEWKISEILSPELQSKWTNIKDDDSFHLEVSIACYVKIPDKPSKTQSQTDKQFNQAIARWEQRVENARDERDLLSIRRQSEFENFLNGYGLQPSTSYYEIGITNFPDSFSCQIRIQGKGLKDLVRSYQYLFDITEIEPIENISQDYIFDFDTSELDILSPDENSPKVCVIDSGIQENHILLESAIEKYSSFNFIDRENTSNTADECRDGGHGTKVAGAILYPREIPKKGTIKLPFWIQNARILDSSSFLPNGFYAPMLMEKIVHKYSSDGTKIFNLSVNSSNPHRINHMSSWAAQIDKLSFEQDVLFIISTGNIQSEDDHNPFIPSIKTYLSSGKQYPDYLLAELSRISNPAQSSFALTVGSVCLDEYEDLDSKSFGKKDDPSSFTKTGLGIWGMIKPDVVEYGGDLIVEKHPNSNIFKKDVTCPELVKSTLNGGKGVGKDSVGTSFAAPKVAHIAASIQKILPSDSALMYRALVAQSARLPSTIFNKPELKHIRMFGYGIPDIGRATGNEKNRVTLIASNEIGISQAHIYSVKIPNDLRKAGDDYDVLLEITLSYNALPRRTRKTTRSYLATRLEWETSKLNNESYSVFKNRIIKEIQTGDFDIDSDVSDISEYDRIPWFIDKRKNWGKIKDLNRNNNTLQKDWTILKSNSLPEEFSLAIIGRKGWEKKQDKKTPYSVTVSIEFLESNILVYENIQIANEIESEVQIEVS